MLGVKVWGSFCIRDRGIRKYCGNGWNLRGLEEFTWVGGV